MRTCFLAALAMVSAGLTGCININVGDWHTVHGSGNIMTETRAVADFDQVSVSGAGELKLSQGDEESLTIEADDNLLPFITSEVSHGHLSIGPRNVNLHSSRTIVYRLKLKNLRDLHLSGSLHAEADGIKTDRLAFKISGSGKVNIAHLEAQTLSASISGSGSTYASGHADKQEINISGSGNHHASELQCAQAAAHISGSGHASLWVTESLTASISGSGHVEYRGTPRVDAHISGSGRVHHQSGAD
jgi:hypothetical protein